MSSTKEMLAISEADRFSRRVGTCRLHAIFMNQSCVYLGIAGGIVKQGRAIGALSNVRAGRMSREGPVNLGQGRRCRPRPPTVWSSPEKHWNRCPAAIL